jgi:hypothetical protein
MPASVQSKQVQMQAGRQASICQNALLAANIRQFFFLAKDISDKKQED